MRRHIIDSINTPPISQEKWKLKHWSWTWIEVKEWWKWSHLYSYKIPYMLCFLRKIYTSLQLDLQKKLLHQRKWFKNSPQVTEKNKCWSLFFFGLIWTITILVYVKYYFCASINLESQYILQQIQQLLML